MNAPRLFAIMALTFSTTAGAQSPAIVFVHGRGQEGRSRAEVRNEFVGAFEQSQRLWLGRAIVPASDIGFVWYADAIVPGSAAALSATCAPLSAAPASGDTIDLRSELMTLAQSLNLDGPALRLITEDTYKYLSSAQTRCEADTRLGVELRARGFTARPLILVAHSMGGIVSFSSLRQNAQTLDDSRLYRIERYVTLGTQVGTPLILKGIVGTYLQPPVPMPRTIRSWANFKNRNDRLAFDVRNSVSVSDSRRRPREISINVPGDRHAIGTYLSNRQVLRAILYPWCRAQSGARKPAECQRVEAAGDPIATTP
ncbi:hypothetical protein [Longimicrobium terrae]|uniref:Pimeloyl-ACP methyl ester carboxylesterase n=1 Tax=Longimicrobium terrae TaxID=1639882 RepID=A0A841GX77_9BACT|nr:hypothetical protein [Longimicrobium terrae]MBB4635999.1 pimeloyl-ACP methyl ester carboxylesterase [Longimicrobium terrae]MBB6070395.1 pimeloyl-ACP methyl ester carboxylesterase [Longimicrobium terrae]NNC30889.1 hypothetical protein [Longimicrobium terrae]